MTHTWSNDLQYAVVQYILRIKNPAKRKYAQDYITAYKAGLDVDRPAGMHFMTAQAVRLRIAELINSIPNGEIIS